MSPTERITLGEASKPATALWSPFSGDAMAHLRSILKDELPDSAACDRVEQSASDILSRCLDPKQSQPRQRTGLIVGYVQSGKTISMTSVASLARDNGFGLVVVLAGTTDNLLDQSWARFKQYLQVNTGPRRLWYMLTSAGREIETNIDGLRGSFDSWRTATRPDRRASAFLVVMKNHTHLDQLKRALDLAGARDIPALVIDDEADQAGLNTNPSGVPSTTYSRITALRSVLGPHTYLQYTATPQAPLLISIAEHLSPDFSVVLEPGAGYAGGKTFFAPPRGQRVQAIPVGDLFAAGSPPSEPPESLLSALRVFLIGTALGYAGNGYAGKNRSMLVHPSPQRTDHDAYYLWVQSACERWKQTLRLPASEPEMLETRGEFASALDELRKTNPGLPQIETLSEDLIEAIDKTLVHKVNSETGAEVDWKNAYSHILVGGQKLNRGYTVEGLTVTYMPRSAGTWTADTIQQLARFFGYKQRYLNLCRVYLNPDLVDVFEAYIEHEEDLREQLRAHPGPLQQWTRALYMNARLRPTRQNVLSDPYYRVDPTKWLTQAAPFDDAILATNRKLFDEFMARISAKLEPHPKAPTKHRVAEVDLKQVLEELLFSYRVVGDHDEAGFYASRYILAQMLKHDAQALASVVHMGKAERSARDGEIVKLHQGYDRKTMGQAYPGAAAICDEQLPTVQLYELDVTFEGGASLKNVPTIAVKLPNHALVRAMIHQANS